MVATVRTPLLLAGVAAYTGAAATLALQPDFALITPAGVAEVSIRQPPIGMIAGPFLAPVWASMERAGAGPVAVGDVGAIRPAQRIVWHAGSSAARGMSRLVVNVFDGADPTPPDRTKSRAPGRW
jgi:hypothetical protein